MVRCLYAKSLVQVNVDGQLTECFEVHRGVKQGCPLSACSICDFNQPFG
uniref:Reverse transcriptase domain-containing protein n=1 Tax=Anguilla anguilla TaxID=7936 RepID=A0A0E9TVX4_ANGAN